MVDKRFMLCSDGSPRNAVPGVDTCRFKCNGQAVTSVKRYHMRLGVTTDKQRQ